MSYRLLHLKNGKEAPDAIDFDAVRPVRIGYVQRAEIVSPEWESINWSGTCSVCGQHLAFHLLGLQARRQKARKVQIGEFAAAMGILALGILANATVIHSTVWGAVMVMPIFFGLLGDAWRRNESNVVAIEKQEGDANHVVLPSERLDVLPTDGVSDIVVSPDGARRAYWARILDKWYVIVDGRRHGPYDDFGADTLTFSADGSRVAWAGVLDRRWTVVVDGDGHGPFGSVLAGTPLFAPRGHRLVWGAQDDAGWFVVVDGQRHGPFETVVAPSHNGDGSRTAWGIHREGRWSVVVDGEEPDVTWDGIANEIFFSPDGQIVYAASGVDGWYLLIGTTRIGPFEKVTLPTYSLDGTHIAWGTCRDAKWTVTVDGSDEASCDDLLKDTPRFSADGHCLVWAGREGIDWYVFVRDFALGLKREGPFTSTTIGEKVANLLPQVNGEPFDRHHG